MKIDFNIPLGSGLPAYAPKKKEWAGIVAAGVSALGSLLGGAQQSGFTKEQQRLQSKLNREEMAKFH